MTLNLLAHNAHSLREHCEVNASSVTFCCSHHAAVYDALEVCLHEVILLLLVCRDLKR